MPRMFQVIQRVAKFSCNYVKRGRLSGLSSFLDSANADDRRENRTCADLFEDKKMFEGMDGEFAKAIEDFLRAVDIEALRLAKRSGQFSLSQYSTRPISVALCRARASAQPVWTYQTRLSPGPPIYGRPPQISGQRNRRLGGQ